MTAPSDDPARSMLIEALTKAEIPNIQQGAKLSPFSSVYWIVNKEGEIEIVLSTFHFNAGSLRSFVRVADLTRHIQDMFSEGEQLAALVDALEYIKSVTLTLLPITQNKLLRRARNTRFKSFPRSDWPALNHLFERVQAAYVDSRAAMEKQLEGRSKPRRGGSEPKLPPEKRESLHVEYDAIHTIAREVKKDYNQTLKRFEKGRRGRGYPNKEWRLYWHKYLSEKYPSVFIEGFLGVFANEDSPSASEVAYRMLSKHTGHKRSYLPQLVAESRKAQKASTIKLKD